jgi:DNA ligase-1
MNFNSLYKKSAKGAIQVWNIRTEDNVIVTEEGLLDGKMREHRIVVKEGKRGLTMAGQAEFEAASKWNDKKKTYWESIEEAQNAGTTMRQGGYTPMFAYPYEKYAKKFSLKGALVQRKYDGIRCVARKIGEKVYLFSRKGLPIYSVSYINRSLNSCMDNGDIFDGELYAHGMDFDTQSGIIRSGEDHEETTGIEYIVYDFPRVGGLDERDPYIDRLKSVARHNDPAAGDELARMVFLTPTIKIDGFQDLQKFHDQSVTYGYEGAMLRDPNMLYENKRSQKLLKYKLFQDDEFPIIGFTEGRGELDGCVGSFLCKTAQGKEFGAKLKAPKGVLADMFLHQEKFAGKYLTVKFQLAPGEDRTALDWAPRFPVGLKIRG